MSRTTVFVFARELARIACFLGGLKHVPFIRFKELACWTGSEIRYLVRYV